MNSKRCVPAMLTAALLALVGCGEAPLHPPPGDEPWGRMADAVLASEREEDSRDPDEERIRTVTGPIPMQTPDGPSRVMFALQGVVGGKASGTVAKCDRCMDIGIRLEGPGAEAYLVDHGLLLRTDDGYRYILEGWAVPPDEPGQEPARQRRFWSELTLRTGEKFEDGDTWTIDGLRCTYDQGDLICV